MSIYGDAFYGQLATARIRGRSRFKLFTAGRWTAKKSPAPKLTQIEEADKISAITCGVLTISGIGALELITL